MAEPIRPNAAAAPHMDGTFVRQIVAHNRYGEAACGWQP